MYAHALYPDFRLRGVEILVFQLAERAAVNGIGVFAAEALYVKQSRAVTYFLVRSERHPYFAVFYAFVAKQDFAQLHNLRYARLVVRAEQSIPRRGDYILPDIV